MLSLLLVWIIGRGAFTTMGASPALHIELSSLVRREMGMRTVGGCWVGGRVRGAGWVDGRDMAAPKIQLFLQGPRLMAPLPRVDQLRVSGCAGHS